MTLLRIFRRLRCLPDRIGKRWKNLKCIVACSLSNLRERTTRSNQNGNFEAVCDMVFRPHNDIQLYAPKHVLRLQCVSKNLIGSRF